MADTEWKPLPAGLWTLPAVFMEAGNLLLEAFMEAGVPTWKVREKTSDPLKWNMIAEGTADSFEAAKAAGVRETTILWKHLLPNILSPIIVSITQDAASVILAEATLSFLGLGVPPPFPSWGRMIEDALPYKDTHPLLLFAPSLMLALTVMAFNFFGDALRDALDPRLRQ